MGAHDDPIDRDATDQNGTSQWHGIDPIMIVSLIRARVVCQITETLLTELKSLNGITSIRVCQCC
jgi:hypothetical protein